ncbi:MAG TPA: 4-oxalocrotonate tautomerase family protein [Geminicoccus sp.]|jgi:4-oxalocrotonate tautomerase|uniref:tautomerase family protein n=1 Tax=Geminicoccus sp. TaxID=2024832 RepID=UPI002E32F048|nr:4-oxalocrotonate tautomerase family protein [Geminicoccus sp.]HEX2529157.1 4-oxalocrotonate tautomerase family protein [Geminicoccus sp.]
MPIITIKLAALRPVENVERQVAADIVRLSTDILRKKPELTAVVVERVDPGTWFAGGASLAEQKASSFWLEIKVVDGTNTKDEKEAFVAAVFSRMRDLLGDLHHESYVHVHEVSADAYGFGGLTQERRYIEGKLGLPARAAA